MITKAYYLTRFDTIGSFNYEIEDGLTKEEVISKLHEQIKEDERLDFEFCKVLELGTLSNAPENLMQFDVNNRLGDMNYAIRVNNFIEKCCSFKNNDQFLDYIIQYKNREEGSSVDPDEYIKDRVYPENDEYKSFPYDYIYCCLLDNVKMRPILKLNAYKVYTDVSVNGHNPAIPILLNKILGSYRNRDILDRPGEFYNFYKKMMKMFKEFENKEMKEREVNCYLRALELM